mgnify:CR=1 FL=1
MIGTREILMAWQFLRWHFDQIVIGMVVLVAAYVLMTAYAPYRRDHRIAKEIQANGGSVEFQYDGPD